MNDSLRGERGLTLLEILIGLAIAILVATALSVASNVSFRSYQSTLSQSHNLLEIQNALNQISNEIRFAESLTTPEDPDSDATEAVFTVVVGGTAKSRRIYVDADQTMVIARDPGENNSYLARGMVQSLNFHLVEEVTPKQLRISVNVKDNSDTQTTTSSTVVNLPNIVEE
jgi:type II secretory pathway component PulJ